jgi:hypothetical protein
MLLIACRNSAGEIENFIARMLSLLQIVSSSRFIIIYFIILTAPQMNIESSPSDIMEDNATGVCSARCYLKAL